jgi:hypothetical protein
VSWQCNQEHGTVPTECIEIQYSVQETVQQSSYRVSKSWQWTLLWPSFTVSQGGTLFSFLRYSGMPYQIIMIIIILPKLRVTGLLFQNFVFLKWGGGGRIEVKPLNFFYSVILVKILGFHGGDYEEFRLL